MSIIERWFQVDTRVILERSWNSQDDPAQGSFCSWLESGEITEGSIEYWLYPTNPSFYQLPFAGYCVIDKEKINLMNEDIHKGKRKPMIRFTWLKSSEYFTYILTTVDWSGGIPVKDLLTLVHDAFVEKFNDLGLNERKVVIS